MTSTVRPPAPAPASRGAGRRSARASRGTAALAGLASAGLALGVAQLVASAVRPQAAPVLAIGSAFIDRTPPWLKDTAIDLFGTKDKLVLLTSMGLVIALLAALAGLAERWRRGAGLLLVVAFGVVAVGAAVTRAGSSPYDAAPSVLGFAVGGVALRLLVERLRQADGAPGPGASGGAAGTGRRPTRRSVLAATAWVAAAAAAAGAAGRALGGAVRDAAAARSALRLPAPATAAPAVPAGTALDVEGISPYLTPTPTSTGSTPP